MNPFQHLYDDFNHGDPAAKHATLPDFPRMIDLEVTSACNFRCLMCPTGNLSLGRKAEFMTFGTFVRIEEQCARHGTALRFIGWGEPTLHPDLTTMIDLASGHGLLTHLNTNGSKIDRPLANALVAFGLSSIKFSFQGVDRASYLEMRKIDFFDGMIRAIETMREARGTKVLPFISVSTSTTRETEEQVARFRERIEPLVDQVNIGKTIFAFMDLKAARLKTAEREFLEKLTAEEHAACLAHPDPCPEVYGKLSVHCDGTARVCCNDYDGVTDLGNVMTRPIAEIWRDKTIEYYRKRLAAKDYGAPLCETCWHYMEGTA